jgi:putative transposase
MPRGPRLVLPELTLHVRHRGHNRAPCFFEDGDYAAYLDYLAYFAREYACSVHAYCLMTNHVHLLVTPHAEKSCALMMKVLGQCYTQHINKARGRCGSLWEGRYRSCRVPSDAYALACYRYIELNPVRAGMVGHARDYPWSSYRANAEGTSDGLVSPHAAYLGIPDYASLFQTELDQALVEDIRKATSGGYAAGSARRPRGLQKRVESATA